jgi:hypothetical protein
VEDRPAARGASEEGVGGRVAVRAASSAGSTEDSSVLLGGGPASELWGAGPMAAPSAMPAANSTAAKAPLTLTGGSRGPEVCGGGGEEGMGSVMAWPAVGPGA